MDDYLPSYRAIHRAQKNNKQFNNLRLQEKSDYEKVHARYC